MNLQKNREGKEAKGGVYTKVTEVQNYFLLFKKLFILPSLFFNFLMVTNNQLVYIFKMIYGKGKD